MPTAPHDTPIKMLNRKPELAVALLRAASEIKLPENVTAELASTDMSEVVPVQFLADTVVVLSGTDGEPVLIAVIEVQRQKDEDKRFSWPVYTTVARSVHKCPATLIVICPEISPATRTWCSEPIPIGHPGFVFEPIVIDQHSIPDPADPALAHVAPELAVLATATHALDLDKEDNRHTVLASLRGLKKDKDRREYLALILKAVPETARRALEAMMQTTPYENEFLDRFVAEGEAKGEAKGEVKGQVNQARRMLLKILAALGEVPEHAREQVMACTDVEQLETWGVRALAVKSVDQVFED